MFQNISPGAIGIRLPLAEALPLAAAAGWAGMDLPADAALALDAERGAGATAELFRAAGVRPGGWGLPLNWRAPYEPDAIGALDAQARLAASLGCTRCYTWVLPFSEELPFRENFERHVRQLRPVARTLEEHGCSFGLEFIGPRTLREGKRYGFISTIDGMLSLAAAIGPNVGLLVDAWHWHTGLGTLGDLRALRLEDVVYVHINDAPAGVPVERQLDNVRRLPGATGVIDLAGFLGALRDLGYAGPVTPEPFDKELAALPPEQSARIAREHLAKVWL